MRIREPRRRALLAGALLGMLAFAPAAGAAAPAPYIPTIYVTYATDCTFAVAVDGGTTIVTGSAPGTTLPPGTYQVEVSVSDAFRPEPPAGCLYPEFALTGPGVSYTTDFVTGNLATESVVEVLAPGATYTMTEGRSPGRPIVFSTATSGSSSSLLSGLNLPEAPNGSNEGTPSTDIVGSDVPAAPARIAATLGAAGKLTLTFAGKRASEVRAGRYAIVVVDRSPRLGLTVAKRGAKAVVLSRGAFRGKHTVRLRLTSGSWLFSAGGSEVKLTVR